MSIKKKIVSVVASAAVLASMCTCAITSASAWSGKIYFETPSDNWRNANKVAYCHYWSSSGASTGPGWQTADEKMKWEDDDHMKASIELPEGEWDLVIMSGDSGWQTYDTVMTSNCNGDTIYVTDEVMENPVDSKKTCIVAKWKNNPDLGPHKVISSKGEVLGNALVPGETDQQMYDTFVKGYDPALKSDSDEHLRWDDPECGKEVTGKSFEEICKSIRESLGLPDPDDGNGSSSDGSSNSDTNSNSDNNSGTTTSNGSTTTGGGSSTSTSGGSSSSGSSSTSSNSTGTNQTGDETPYIALGAVLLAAAGVAFLARKKKVTE